MEEATARTGLDDWGALGFAERLQLLLDSCADTGRLSAVGWRALHKNALRCLENRLRLQAYVTAHTEVADEPLPTPVVITGLPRTGTTLLHSLVALDPANRFLPFWQALRPVPPDPSNGLSEDSLVEEAETWLRRLYERAPEFRAVHASTAHTPEECDVLFQNAFASWHFEIAFRADAYSDWLGGATLFDEYAYYGLQLKALTHSQPGRRWVLKSPSHLGHLDALVRTLPDATVVHCHRTPLASIPSFVSLVVAVRTPYSAEVSPEEIGRQWLQRFSTAWERELAARDRHGDDRFVDISYRKLVADPIGSVGALYDRLGRRVSGDFHGRMQRWLADNPRHKHGVHHYALDQFGLTAQDVMAAFASYGERFAPALAE